MKKQFFEYFYYTRKERNGVIILALLCVLINLIPKFLYFIAPPAPDDFQLFKAEVAKWESSMQVAPIDSLFPFDPNSVNKDELLALGFSSKVANTLISFRSKGGHFYQNEDLKKIYGVSDDLYTRVAPFIQIEKEKSSPKTWKKAKPYSNNQKKAKWSSFPPIQIDINKASAEEWKKLRGIGPVLSERIVKFRDKLGGFSSINQVAETYGLADSTFQAIQPQLKFSPIYKTINLNSADAATLQAHPYLNWRQAKALVSYREIHGHYKNIEDIRKLKGLSEEECVRLEPYLKF